MGSGNYQRHPRVHGILPTRNTALWLILVFFAGLAPTLFGQDVSVKGRVLDAETGQGLPFANVFIDRTTIGTATDVDGNFLLRNVPIESEELLFSFVGYQLGKINLRLKEGDNDIGVVRLAPGEQQLSEVEVKVSRDKTWEKQLKKFEKVFLGDDEIASNCKIVNPWVIDFSDKVKGKQLTAHASAPLEIENNALGYKLYFYLTDFWKSAQGYLIDGKVRFEQMPIIDDVRIKNWMQNREKAYVGSVQHLMKAIISRRIKGEKFYLYTERPGLENATARSQIFSEAMADALMFYDTSKMVTPVLNQDIFKVRMPGRIEVHNHNERSTPRVYRDMGYEVSWITLAVDEILVNAEGFPLHPTDVVTAGAMSDQRVSYLLPQDYERGKIKLPEPEPVSMERFAEKVYVQTDKPYYYQGEPLWFKAYLNHADPILRDSMSKVLYVDLIGPDKKIIQSKTLMIDDGMTNGDFILDDKLRAGTYYLRAYTNWSRNFADGMFVKGFALLNLMDKVDPTSGSDKKMESEQLTVVTEKDVYRTRDEITLNLIVTTREGDPIGSRLSISVTDLSQVVTIEETQNITADFNVRDQSVVANDDLLPLEFGVTVKGRFYNDKGKPEQTLLNVMQFDPYALYFTQSDSLGYFSMSGLQAYDSINLFFKSEKAKKAKYGKVELINSSVPIGSEVDFTISLKTEDVKSPQRIISDYEVPKDARILETVEIRDTRIDEQAIQRYVESYGRPDYVLEADKLNTTYGNLLMTLNGQLPGLVVRETNDPIEGPKWVIYTERARSSSMTNPPPPLITINNVAMGGDAAVTLGAIDPNTISRIELTTRLNSNQGSLGAGGVLAIYTKTGAEVEGKPVDPNFQSLTIPGFYKPRSFRMPYHNDPKTDKSIGDYRSTLYWNPNVVTDHETGKASVSFYAADLETTYRVVVEGVTDKNEPVRAEYFIRVQN